MNRLKKNLLPGYLCLGLSAAGMFSIESAQAAPLWSGTANYNNAGTVDPGEDIVGPFNQYHFGSGVILTSPLNPSSLTVGQTVSGWFQSSVDEHKLLSSGATVSSPQLNSTGSGSGYELTLVSDFSFKVTNIDAFGNINFGNATGTSTLYFDTTPDYSFAADSGFSNGNVLMAGAITGGNGVLTGFGIGAGQYSLDLTGSFGSYNSAVYNPGIAGANALFSLNANSSPLINSVTNVQGHSVTGGFVATTTGTLSLTAVPVPAAVWLFGSVLLGWTSLVRRKALAA